ncbi:UNVERIFIED_CONTAM: hypothetical protein Sindi_0245300 [Sesamum indicum]
MKTNFPMTADDLVLNGLSKAYLSISSSIVSGQAVQTTHGKGSPLQFGVFPICLRWLAITYSPSLAVFPDNHEHLSALKILAIISCPLIELLPDGIKHATALPKLEIRSCPRITELGNFAALRTLAILDCQNLKTLLVTIRRLSKLHHLSTQGCPCLQGR